MKGKIGVFDSGFGGLDVLHGIVKRLPQYHYVYLGDTARAPYGTRSPETVYDFARQGVEFLFTKNCDLVILACNTASSDALRRIQREYLPKYNPKKKVLGVLIPAAEEAIAVSKTKRIGVIATEGTVRSGAFARELLKLDSTVKVFQQACPLLVPIVEAGEERTLLARMALGRYLAPLMKKKIDTLILGCTHYGILEKQIRIIVGPHIKIISEARVVPRKLENYLARHPEIEKQLGKKGIVQFYSTDLTERFRTLGSRFFGQPIGAKLAKL